MKIVRYTCAAAVCAVGVVFLGCGPSSSEVKGTVTLDGKPVEGATVVFTSDDGSIATGFTDASGNFNLMGGTNKGVLPGTYKATVTKVASLGEVTSPALAGDPTKIGKDYSKVMEKIGKESSTSSAGPKGPAPPSMNMGVSSGPKTELPKVYASPGTTPFTNIKVPTDGPVKLEMTGSSGGTPKK